MAKDAAKENRVGGPLLPGIDFFRHQCATDYTLP
jgi:hypothetical protein